MNPNPKPLSARHLAPVLLVAAALAVGLVGIGWGLPSQKRNKFYFSGRPPQAPQISQEAAEQSWRYFPEFSWAEERRSEPENLSGRISRSVFNPIRSYHPDEYVVLKSISNMKPAVWDFDPKFFAWPSLFIYLVAAALKLASLIGLVTLRQDLGFYYEHPEQMARLYLVGRLIVCFFGAGTVAATYCLGKRLCDWRVGAAAGALLLLSPAFIVNVHAMTPDVPMVFFGTLALMACLRIVECAKENSGPTWRPYLLAGLFAGLAMGCKHEGAYLALVMATAHFTYLAGAGRVRRGGWSVEREAKLPVSLHTRRFTLHGRLLAGLALAVAVFALTSPYHVLHIREFLWVASHEVASVRAPLPLFAVLIPWHMLTCCIGIGAMFFAGFAAFGMFPGRGTWDEGRGTGDGGQETSHAPRPSPLAPCPSCSKTLALFISLVILYALSVCAAPQYVRHYLIFLPLIAVLAPASVYSVMSAASKVPGTLAGWRAPFQTEFPSRSGPGGLFGTGRVLGVVIICGAFVCGVFLPLVSVSVSFLHQFIGKNTRDEAAQWIAANVPAGAEVALVADPWQYTTPPLDTTRYRIVTTDYDYEKLSAERPGYLILSSADFVYPYGLSLPLPKKLEFQMSVEMLSKFQKTAFERPLNPIGRPLFAQGFTWPEDMLFTNPRVVVYKFRW